MKSTKQLFVRRRNRTRGKLRQANTGHVRLTVFRSSKHIYAQVIDDAKGNTVAAASSIEKALKDTFKSGASKEAAGAVGKLVARKLKVRVAGKMAGDLFMRVDDDDHGS